MITFSKYSDLYPVLSRQCGMWTLIQLNTSTILSYSRSVETENHQIRSNQIKTKIHQCKSVPVAQLSVPSTGLWIFWDTNGFGPHPVGILLSTAHTHILSSHVRWNHSTPIIDMGGYHRVLASLMCSWLQCNEATPQQWTPLASYSTKLWLFSTSPFTPLLSGCPN